MNALLLVIATAIWGMGFVTSKWLLEAYDPMWANSLRYILAAICSLPFLLKWKSLTRSPQVNRYAIFASVILFVSMLAQIIGLKYTTVAKNGFITVFYAVFTPILAMMFYRRRYNYSFWGLILIALAGIFLLCNLEFSDINIGDWWTLLCAFLFAFHILYVDKISKSIQSALEFNMLQCFYMGIYGVIFGFLFEGPVDLTPLMNIEDLWRPSALSGLIYLAIFSSIIAFSVQVHTQKEISPHIVALIFLLESPFAALFGYIFLGETLSLMNIAGCALVVLAVGLIPFTCRPAKRKEIASV